MAWHVVEEKVSGHASHYNIKSDVDKWEVAQTVYTIENARLIAAAPDMLEALEWALSHHNCPAAYCQTLADIQAAISKAKGGEDATDN